MPFTISHTAAVIPLFRSKRLDPLALVIGSMAPDLGYFAHRFSDAAKAHALEGTILIALPLGWVVWLACRPFGALFATPLPGPVASAVRKFLSGPPWKKTLPLRVTLSLLLGIWSHTFLDAFTHENGWFVQRLPLLRLWSVYHLLQHLGSVAGMLVLAALYWRWRENQALVPVGAWRKLVLVVVLAALCATLPAWDYASRFDGYLQLRAFVFRWVVNTMALSACGYLALALALRLKRRDT